MTRLKSELNAFQSLEDKKTTDQETAECSASDTGMAAVSVHRNVGNIIPAFSDLPDLSSLLSEECNKNKIKWENLSKDAIAMKNRPEPEYDFPKELKFTVEVKSVVLVITSLAKRHYILYIYIYISCIVISETSLLKLEIYFICLYSLRLVCH